MWYSHLVTRKRFREIEIRIYKQKTSWSPESYFYTFFYQRDERGFGFSSKEDALSSALNKIEELEIETFGTL